MYLPKRWLKERGASVLAALVLVALLGAVLIVLQYARSSGDFAYDSAALTADAAAPAASSQAPAPKGCTTNPSNGQKTCPCNQTEANPTDASGSKDSIEQCQPGCAYRIIPGVPAKIQALPSPQNSDPNATSGTVQVCSNFNGDTCSTITCKPGSGSLSSNATSLTAAAVSIAPASVGTQLISTFTSNNTGGTPETQALSAAFASNPSSDPAVASNINNAQQALANESAIPDTAAASNTKPPSTTQTNPDLTNSVTTPTPADVPVPIPRPADDSQGSLSSVCATGDPALCSGKATGAGASTFPQVAQDQTTVPAGNSTPCPAGQSGTPCAATPAAVQQPQPINNNYYLTPGLNGNNSGFGNSNSSGSLLTSFLTGLAQGATQGILQQNALADQQQAQDAYAPYGTGNDGNSCPQPQQQPDPSQCNAGSWRQLYQSNQCPTSWQCVPNPTTSTTPAAQATPPTAQLSCQPQVADVGMTVTMSYSCGNATGSAGSGFVTGNQLSGSTTTVVTAPPAGDNTASYGLTCINKTVTAGAQCSVQINTPSIVLVANPSVVPAGTSAAVGWVTSGMKSCTISSPTNPSFTAANTGNTSVNGVATTSALTAAMTVTLKCVTQGGGTKSASASIAVGAAPAGGSGTSQSPITVSSSADNGSIAHGSAVTINWNATNPPAGSAMLLALVNKQTGQASDVVAGGLATSGQYTWNVPAVGATCNQNASNVCATDLVQGGSYAIEAVIYTPTNAYVGDGSEPTNPVAPVYGASAVSGNFTLDDSQQQGSE